MFIAVISIITLIPIASYTGRVLVQTTPPHVCSQIDTSLSSAHVDGVLEFRHEYFWNLSFRKMVNSLTHSLTHSLTLSLSLSLSVCLTHSIVLVFIAGGAAIPLSSNVNCLLEVLV